MAKFDSKSFNPQAFGAYVNRIPNVTKNELAKSGAVGSNEQAKAALANQTGSLYARIPYFGRIDGSTSQNNDGATNITSTGTTTYEQGFIVASRMDSWTERSFSKNITAGVDFMDNVAAQIADYKMDVRQAMLLAILKGVFSMKQDTSVAGKAAKEFLDMGFFIGVGGVVTFKNARKLVETVEEVPVTRIVLETDCPYMAPEPHRGTRNDSRNIRYVAEKIAQIKGITAQEVIDITNENAKKLFF